MVELLIVAPVTIVEVNSEFDIFDSVIVVFDTVEFVITASSIVECESEEKVMGVRMTVESLIGDAEMAELEMGENVIGVVVIVESLIGDFEIGVAVIVELSILVSCTTDMAMSPFVKAESAIGVLAMEESLIVV